MPELVPPLIAPGEISRRAQPELSVEDLLLRPWRLTDAAMVVEAYRDPDIQRWHVQSASADEALAWVSSRPALWTTETGAEWAITEADRVIGRVRVRFVDLEQGEGEAGYWVLPVARGRNVAGRSLTAVTDWLFAELGLHRIELRHSTANLASCRVAAKAAYLYEGTMRSQVRHADGWHDMHRHARVNA